MNKVPKLGFIEFDQAQLKLGMTGASITNLHRQLVLLGIQVPSEELQDDRFGLGTEAVIRSFQVENGLPMTGVVDDATARALGIGALPTAITGVVSRPDGTPLEGVAVYLLEHEPDDETILAEARSAAGGAFSLPWPE